jgi:hypothetical protein
MNKIKFYFFWLINFMYQILVWMERATGIGYKEFPKLDEHIENAKRLERKSIEIEHEMEKLKEELEQHGYSSRR